MSSAASEIDDLIGLDRAKNTVRQLILQDSPVSVVLIFGAPRSGKSTLANYLAQAWMCPHALPSGACGECVVCRTFKTGRAVDFQLIQPYGKGNMIKLDAIHEVDRAKSKEEDPFEGVNTIEFFRTRPLMARRKVIHFAEADRMNTHASNAILKTLEELPPHAKVILSTSNIGRILPTIRSRCLCLACELPAAVMNEGELFEVKRTLALTPGDIALIDANTELFEDLHGALVKLGQAPQGAALQLSEAWRGLAERFTPLGGGKARAGQVLFFSFVAQGLFRLYPNQPQNIAHVSEASRCIEGNAQAALVFDDLLMKLLS